MNTKLAVIVLLLSTVGADSDTLNLIVAGDARGHLHFLRLEEPKAKG